MSNIEYLIDGDDKINNKKEIADTFVKYFSNIGCKLASKIDNNIKYQKRTHDVNQFSIFLRPTSADEIEKVFNNLKMKSGGVDSINSKVLKCLNDKISGPLEHIFNICFSKGIWPSALKAAEIIPVFKAGDKHEPSNYRPISLISNVAKIMEKIVYVRLIDFVNKHKIISDRQYGFVKNRSTNDAISFVTEHVYKNLGTNRPTAIAFLDLAKAFDTVNHSILLNKLEAYGIRGSVMELIRSYLSERYQCVKIGNELSKRMLVKVGVPQGTILGPLLFILYINDIFKVVPDGSLVSYADDTAVLCSGKNWND
jgi:hypothetical protein